MTDLSRSESPSGKLPVVTVAVIVKVFDGVVLAADSATTLPLSNGSHQVWNNADKIFHLHRKLPVAAMTWGLGGLGSASVSTIAKDLRRRLEGRDPAHLDWELDGSSSVEQVADRLVEFVFDEQYQPIHSAAGAAAQALGFLVAGYSGDAQQPEGWEVIIENAANRPIPQPVAPIDVTGWNAWAQPAGTVRLFNGFDPQLPEMLQAVLDPGEWAKIEPIFANRTLSIDPANDSMPLPDAIHLAKFLVDVTVGYSHYTLGPDTVGGAVEVASMSRHEGFKWISRKHYYPPALNPEDPGHGY